MNKHLLFCIALCAIVSGCKEKTIIEPHKRDTFYDKGTATFYGAYYEEEGIRQNVIAIDLYSPGLGLDSAGYMTGTGANLYFSDIFLAPADTFPPAGTYEADTTALPLTFLPGMNYEGNISGAYVLDITDGSLTTAEILTGGRFSLQYKGDSVQIDFRLQNEAGKEYVAQFKGVLPLYDGRKP